MPTLEKAIAIAAQAHEAQCSPSGEPYIFNPVRTMLQMGSTSTRIVAVLHDAISHASITLPMLEKAGFAPHIIEALQVLSQAAKKPPLQAARCVAQNTIARAVQLIEISTDMDISHIDVPSSKDWKRLEELRQARHVLLAAA